MQKKASVFYSKKLSGNFLKKTNEMNFIIVSATVRLIVIK